MIKILLFIWKHPLNKDKKLKSILKFFLWQIATNLWNASFVYDWINGSRLIVRKGMTGATGNIYVGLMEYEDMSFLLHYLHKDDLFFDIGANVGVYTILASKVKNSQTICIEPLPSTYEKLKDNIQINRLTNVTSLNIGLSSEKSKLYFTTDKDTMNGVALLSNKNTQEIDVDTLDNLARIHGIPKIIKIDVEGYESNIILGGKSTLINETVEVIILELNGSGLKYGFNDDEIHTDLKTFGFDSFTYNPFKRELIKLEKYGTHNTIYIRKSVIEKIEKIIQDADPFECNGLLV